MKKQLFHIFTILMLLLWGNFSQAQTFIGEIDFNDENQTQIIQFKNGDQKVGRILSIKNIIVEFKEKGQSEISKIKLSDLDKIIVINEEFDASSPEGLEKYKNIDAEKHGKQIPKTRGNNRLFYSETGFNLSQGESEYHTLWGRVHNFDYAPSDGLTVGIGYIIDGFFTAHLKFNYITKSLHSRFRAGFDFKLVTKPERFFDDFEQRTRLGWEGYFQLSPYFSFGNDSRSAHVAINVIPIYSRTEFFESGLITFSFGGMVKLFDHWKLIYENTLGILESSNASNFGFFTGLGVNWFNDKNSIKMGIHPSPNFGFFNIPISDINSTARLPFFSYSRYF